MYMYTQHMFQAIRGQVQTCI